MCTLVGKGEWGRKEERGGPGEREEGRKRVRERKGEREREKGGEREEWRGENEKGSRTFNLNDDITLQYLLMVTLPVAN